MQKHKEQLTKLLSHSKDKKKKEELEVVTKVVQFLEEKKQIRLGDWKASEIEHLNTFQLLTAKPVCYLVNMNQEEFIKKKSKWLGKIKAWVDNHGGEPIVPFCGAFEAKIVELETEEAKKKFCEEQGCQSSIPKIIRTGYHSLDLVHFFTCGSDEVKCWTIRAGTKAPQAAGVIHTDFERGFICAEVMKFDEFKELGSESAVKAAGKYRQEGKTYTVCDGDIIFFKFNVSGGKK